jgi:hypothetical protein
MARVQNDCSVSFFPFGFLSVKCLLITRCDNLITTWMFCAANCNANKLAHVV